MASPAEDLIVKTYKATAPFKRHEIRCSLVAERVGFTYEEIDAIVSRVRHEELVAIEDGLDI